MRLTTAPCSHSLARKALPTTASPSGNRRRAGNAFGLTTQTPSKNIYLTNGPSRRVVLGKRVVDLRHASPKHLIAPGSPAGTVVQALQHVGPLSATDVAQVAAHHLSASDKKTLAASAFRLPPGCGPRSPRSPTQIW